MVLVYYCITVCCSAAYPNNARARWRVSRECFIWNLLQRVVQWNVDYCCVSLLFCSLAKMEFSFQKIYCIQ